MYILVVIFQSRSSKKEKVCTLSVGKVLLFVIRMLSCVMIIAVPSICLMASKILRCTLDTLITEFCFPGRISRVNFVIDILFTTVAVVVCSMRRL